MMVPLIAVLAGVAAAKHRSSQSAIMRHVTIEDIDTITRDQVPEDWLVKFSLSRARRRRLVRMIKAQLDECFFVMGITNAGMGTYDMNQARELFPEQVQIRMLKNTLVKKAMEGTGWEPFGETLKGPNLFIFVKEDKLLKPTIEGYLKMLKQFRRKDVVAGIYEKMSKVWNFELKPSVGGIIRDEWNVIPFEDLPKLKDFPTKTELIGQIAGSVKQVTTKVARGTKQVSQKIAIGTKKIVEKMEEEGKDKVADAVA